MIEIVLELWINGQWVERDRRTLVKPLYRIGRGRECEIYIDYCGFYIGRQQCTLTRYEPLSGKRVGYKIRDGVPNQPSKNGTWLNGARLDREAFKLKSGDTVVLVAGHLRFRYLSGFLAVGDSVALPSKTDRIESLVSDS